MTEKSRLLWRCRRGIREMDIVFQDFIKKEYDILDDAEKHTLDALLNEADLDILNWLMGKEVPDSEGYKQLIHRIQISRNIA